MGLIDKLASTRCSYSTNIAASSRNPAYGGALVAVTLWRYIQVPTPAGSVPNLISTSA